MPPPPFQLTPAVVRAHAEVMRLIGQLEGIGGVTPQPRLRRRNRIRTVYGSVGIEGNTLSADVVSRILDGKHVVGPTREIREVENAITAYAAAPRWRFISERDLLSAHRVLMSGLVADAGRYRAGNVGVMHGSRVTHVAPQAARVPALVRSLLQWAARAKEPRVIVACVVHYELQFIHPFSDGNGRMGRLWQHVGLLSESEAFAYAPVESIIRERQQRYYDVLGRSDRAGDCTPFLEFSLAALGTALRELLERVRPEREDAAQRLERAHVVLGHGWFTRADYLRVFPRLSTATGSRDLKEGASEGLLDRVGDKRLARYRFRRRS